MQTTNTYTLVPVPSIISVLLSAYTLRMVLRSRTDNRRAEEDVQMHFSGTGRAFWRQTGASQSGRTR